MSYRPAVGQINFNIASIDIVQNIDNISGSLTPFQPEDQGLSPLVVAQYMLYDREQEDNTFGLDDAEYLGHKGGFITQGDKLNAKLSDLYIFGKFTVRQKVNLYKNVDISFNSVINAQRRGSVQTTVTTLKFVDEVYKSNIYDFTGMTVGDVREFSYVKGMIIPWVGSYSDLFTRLPYWRLCAPPDSGKTINDIIVPNLVGKFILGGGYASATDEGNNVGTSSYQPKDNASRNWGSSTNLNIGTTGGNHAVKLTLAQMPIHNHNVRYAIEGGVTTITSSGLNSPFEPFYAGGEVSLGALVTASDQCIRSWTFSCSERNCNRRMTCEAPKHGSGSSVVAINSPAGTLGTMTINDPAVSGGVSNTIRFVGESETHNNLPPYMALAYIIYVGEDRGLSQIPPGVLNTPTSRTTSNSLWMGFGASTSTFANQHWIYDVRLTSFYDEVGKGTFIGNSIYTFPSVPINDAAIVDNNIRLTENIQGERGNIFYNKRIFVKNSLNQLIDWQAYFSFSMGGGAGTGDGLSFIFNNQGASVPDTGTTFGYLGLPSSFSVIIDTRSTQAVIKICQNGSDATPIASANITNFTISSPTQEKRYIWMTYTASTGQLRVFLNNINIQPSQPIVSGSINIQSILI